MTTKRQNDVATGVPGHGYDNPADIALWKERIRADAYVQGFLAACREMQRED